VFLILSLAVDGARRGERGLLLKEAVSTTGILFDSRWENPPASRFCFALLQSLLRFGLCLLRFGLA